MKTKPSCAFCDSTEDLLPCSWPAKKFVMRTYGDLAFTDRVQRAHGGRPNARPAVVESIETIPTPDMVFGTRRYHDRALEIVLRIKGKGRTIRVFADSPVQVERYDTCDAFCCPNHRVERSDKGGTVCCMDHWMAWAQVA